MSNARTISDLSTRISKRRRWRQAQGLVAGRRMRASVLESEPRATSAAMPRRTCLRDRSSDLRDRAENIRRRDQVIARRGVHDWAAGLTHR